MISYRWIYSIYISQNSNSPYESVPNTETGDTMTRIINAANKFIKDAHIPFDVFYDEDNNYLTNALNLTKEFLKEV